MGAAFLCSHTSCARWEAESGGGWSSCTSGAPCTRPPPPAATRTAHAALPGPVTTWTPGASPLATWMQFLLLLGTVLPALVTLHGAGLPGQAGLRPGSWLRLARQSHKEGLPESRGGCQICVSQLRTTVGRLAPQTWILPGLGTRNLRWGCRPGCFLSSPLSLAYTHRLLPGSSHGHPSVCPCPELLFSEEHTSD